MSTTATEPHAGSYSTGGSLIDRHLFIAGCPRSGTSALVFLLNEHPQIALGFERFKRVRSLIEPFHFTPSQFFSPVLAETDIRGELLYRRLSERWQSGTVSVVGDKVPLYWRVLTELLARFPQGRIVLLVRKPEDVAASFVRRARDPDDWWPVENDHTVAVRMWNEALERTRDAERQGHGERVFLLPYEPLLAGNERWLSALMAFVGIPPAVSLLAEQRRLAELWSSVDRPKPSGELCAYVHAHSDPELTSWAHARMERQLERSEAQPTPSAENRAGHEHSPPTDPNDQHRRQRERAQLIGEMRRPGRPGAKELQTLELRFLDQARELVRRADRARLPANARRPGFDRGKPRMTFILPHQRATTGGVYVIEQLARHLAERAAVNVLVRGGRSLRTIQGVDVRAAPRLDPDCIPKAEVLVYPADMSDAALVRELPADTGKPVMFFQGYGTPGSRIVADNLAAAEASVAIAHWLVGDALCRGTPCAYVPQGLDRETFAPGVPSSQRSPRISVMTHKLDWKGLADALAAIARVRVTRPDVEVLLFGSEPVEGVGSFVASPTRPQVAALLRSSAVHVVASWEEGFGLTGAEAIACGAALATTDTKGSRDYALDGHTALVSEPRDPTALADNILRLLDDAHLRDRLVLAGQRHLRGVMPPWHEAARRMAFALLEQ